MQPLLKLLFVGILCWLQATPHTASAYYQKDLLNIQDEYHTQKAQRQGRRITTAALLGAPYLLKAFQAAREASLVAEAIETTLNAAKTTETLELLNTASKAEEGAQLLEVLTQSGANAKELAQLEEALAIANEGERLAALAELSNEAPAIRKGLSQILKSEATLSKGSTATKAATATEEALEATQAGKNTLKNSTKTTPNTATATATEGTGQSVSKGTGNVTRTRKSYSEPTFNAFKKQLQQHGKRSLYKSRTTIQNRLNEHLKKLNDIKKAGGYASSVEREINAFKDQLHAIDDLLKQFK